MEFPTNVNIKVNNQSEYDEIMLALHGWQEELQKRGNGDKLNGLLKRVKLVDDKGKDIPSDDAYVSVAGKVSGKGTLKEMTVLFNQEVAGHGATVVLYKKTDTKYSPIMTRKAKV